MLDKSAKFRTVLTIGPRLRKFQKAGLAEQLLWEEQYPDQEGETRDGRGDFQRTREWIEQAPLQEVFDLWCRGQNLIGYSALLLDATAAFRSICREAKHG